MNKQFLLVASAIGLSAITFAARPASAGTFVNGGFEDGVAGTYAPNGWTVGSGDRSGANLSSLNPSAYLGLNGGGPSGGNRSAVVSPGLDPTLGALMPNIVYSGNYSYRVEDSGVPGGWLSVISQTVANYGDPQINFAWLAALDNGGHTQEQSAAMIITLKDLTANDTPISRIYNAGGGTDSRFNSSGSYYYTPAWQIETLAIDASRFGHDFELTVLATDCGPTGHSGYVYLDGFGGVTPPPGNQTTPEPTATLGLLAFGGLGLALKRKKKG